jgi:hypothetical protein
MYDYHKIKDSELFDCKEEPANEAAETATVVPAANAAGARPTTRQRNSLIVIIILTYYINLSF